MVERWPWEAHHNPDPRGRRNPVNHLAHLLLAGPDDGFRLGALLGDHVKGQLALAALPPDRAAGVRLHRLIDGYCDRHPAVTHYLASLQPPWRRYGGIILDVLMDHCLDRHWKALASCPLADFADQIDALFERERDTLPPRLQRFSLWARRRGLWCRYGDRELLGEIFSLLAARHGRPSPLARGLELLDRDEAQVETVFLRLFPDLESAARRWRSELSAG